MSNLRRKILQAYSQAEDPLARYAFGMTMLGFIVIFFRTVLENQASKSILLAVNPVTQTL